MHSKRYKFTYKSKEAQNPPKQEEKFDVDQLDSKQLIKLLMLALLNELNKIEEQEKNVVQQSDLNNMLDKKMQKKSPSHDESQQPVSSPQLEEKISSLVEQLGSNIPMNNLNLNSLAPLANLLAPAAQLEELNSSSPIQQSELLVDESSSSENDANKHPENENKSEGKNKKQDREKREKQTMITRNIRRRRSSR